MKNRCGCWITAFFAVLVMIHASRADYLKASRASVVRGEPKADAAALTAIESGAELILVDDVQTKAHYRVVAPGLGQVGWVSRYDVRRYPGQPSGAAPADVWAARHLALGKPVLVHERIREGYAAAVDARLKIPIWVQYELAREDLDGPADRKGLGFKTDKSLPKQAQAVDDDYTHSTYARGHMAPAEDMTRSKAVMLESFLLSNAAPQEGPRFNGAIWARLEEATRDWVRLRGKLTVITGPIFAPSPLAKKNGEGPTGKVSYFVIGKNQLAVPTHFFKIVIDRQQAEALAFLMPNDDLTGRKFSEFPATIADIEQQSGLDLLAGLPADVRQKLRNTKVSAPWPQNGTK